MIDTRLESALSRFEPDEFTRVKAIAESATLDLLKGRGAGSEWLGWRRIVRDPDRDLLGAVRKHAEQIRSESDLLVVCGIGGSYLGAKALVDLFPDKQEDGLQVRFAGYHIGGSALERLIREMETPRPDGEEKRIHINVISKSGSTLETALAFRVLRGWMEKKYGSEAKRRITVTTGPDGGVLNPMGHKLGYKRFVIPEDTGGRFSVLTPVGLLPVAAAGLDIEALFAGAESMAAELERPDIRILTYASARYLLHQAGVSIDVVGSFEPELESLTAWIQQLLGESEGKEGKGIFPVSAAWSTDLHSIGQMVQEGRRNVMETLLVVDQPI
ncbi:MAG: glucose-6-phosphate isomerase, partial [Balneolaceae bacterium]